MAAPTLAGARAAAGLHLGVPATSGLATRDSTISQANSTDKYSRQGTGEEAALLARRSGASAHQRRASSNTNVMAGDSPSEAAHRRQRRASIMSITAVPTPFDVANGGEDADIAVMDWVDDEQDYLNEREDLDASQGGKGAAAPRRPRATALGPRAKWRHAIKAVTTLTSTARQFHTLRDMLGPAKVSPSRIKVISVLGKGAFAIVEKCLYLPEGSHAKPLLVAVKRLKPALTHNELDIKDMMQEVALLRKLAHRQIVGYFGYGHWAFNVGEAQHGSLFIVEELVDGGSLKSLVVSQMEDKRELKYRTRDAVRWLAQVAGGLAYLHRALPQVIHRDLKLDNILLKGSKASTCEAKIADFGLSALVRRTQAFAQMHKEMTSSKALQPRRARRASATDLDEVWATAFMQRTLTKDQDQAQPADTDPSASHAKQHKQQGGAAPTAAAANTISAGTPAPGQPQEVVAGGNAGGRTPSRRNSIVPLVTLNGGLVPLEVTKTYAQLSGRTGTLLYMAPEVYKREVYSEKVDCFSFAVIAFELLHRFMMISATDGSVEECQAYARRVSRGFRPPMSRSMPTQLSSLVEACWQQDPTKRPSMEKVAQHLKALQSSATALAAFDALDAHCLAGGRGPRRKSSGVSQQEPARDKTDKSMLPCCTVS